MNYTENYHLPQWEETDRIMMDDFNEAMAGIEEGITEAKAAADQAQETADEAAVPTFVTGDYIGNGEKFRVFPLDFAPQAVIVVLWRAAGETEVAPQTTWAFAIQGQGGYGMHISGSSIILSKGNDPAGVNKNGCWYTYIAFR